jgi:hypothetical protein
MQSDDLILARLPSPAPRELVSCVTCHVFTMIPKAKPSPLDQAQPGLHLSASWRFVHGRRGQRLLSYHSTGCCNPLPEGAVVVPVECCQGREGARCKTRQRPDSTSRVDPGSRWAPAKYCQVLPSIAKKGRRSQLAGASRLWQFCVGSATHSKPT